MSYHCPKCFSNNTRRAILIDSFDDLKMPNGESYRPELHGSPYVCNDCHNVFAVGIERMPYAEHIDKIREESEMEKSIEIKEKMQSDRRKSIERHQRAVRKGIYFKEIDEK